MKFIKDALYKVTTAIHRAVFNISKGRIFGKAFGMPIVELVTTGRRSGKERSTMLAVPIADADRLVLVASYGGDDRHPAWYLNLRANPEVRVTTAGSTRTMIARTATDEEKHELWPRITSRYQGYADYQKRTERPIPVVILESPGSHTSTDNGKTYTKAKQRRSATMGEPPKTYIPGMGHDWLLPLYDALHKLLGFESVHRQLVDQAGIRPNHRVIEIGCGTGNVLILIKRLHPHAEVVGLDPDPKALARARRKAEREAIFVQLDRGFAEELPYPDASFDRVFSAFMFHHLGPDEKEKTLQEARRALKPGGSLHLLDFGGAKVRSDGFIARLLHRTERLRDNFGDRIPTLMREAGFADPTEVAHRVTIFGRAAYYRATVLRAESGAA